MKRDIKSKAEQSKHSGARRVRTSAFENVERSLHKWFMDTRESKGLRTQPPSRNAWWMQDFAASSGWLQRFKARYDNVGRTVSGESEEANLESIKKWLEQEVLVALLIDPNSTVRKLPLGRMPPKVPAANPRLSDNEEDDLSTIIGDAIAGHGRQLQMSLLEDRAAMLQAIREERSAMQDNLVTALQQLFPRGTQSQIAADTTQTGAGPSTSSAGGYQPSPQPTFSQGPATASGYSLQSALGGYDAAPAAQAAAFGQPHVPPPLQAAYGPPHAFPPPPPVDVGPYAQNLTPKQRIFTVHDLPSRRELGEAFIHVQNANRSSQLLSRRDIIELQILEAFLDTPRTNYEYSTGSVYSITWPHQAGAPPSTGMRTPPQATSSAPLCVDLTLPEPPAQKRGKPPRQSRRDNPKKNPGKDDKSDLGSPETVRAVTEPDHPLAENTELATASRPLAPVEHLSPAIEQLPSDAAHPKSLTLSPSTNRTRPTPLKWGRNVSSDTYRTASPPSPSKRSSEEILITSQKKTKVSPKKRTLGGKQPDPQARPILK
ncbi:hypothetical protein HPB47_005853 [Ixodes persulcatus]|uniref:Uncharacterized protein n=1 Tax=Ixodes persulcatus TaxID=34615 RepID=A0AC60PCM8_IXOPE|nr:hypothetical protein HPB47_005853 [Ixodes persulcatus]